MEQQVKVRQIDFLKIYKSAMKHRKLYLYSIPIAFVLACFVILSVPRYYSCTVELAPETSTMSANSLGDIASSFGLSIGGNMAGSDAIFPELYPQLMQSVDFRTSLFAIPVKTIDGEISTTYYDYLAKHQEKPWWSAIFMGIGKVMALIFPQDDMGRGNGGKVNPFMLTREQLSVCRAIEGNVVCSVDKQTSVITLTVTDQDPLVCAVMADSVKNRLQLFITEYRTNKANIDLKYTEGLYKKAKSEYEEARGKYAVFSDENTGLILQSVKSKLDDLENDMQLKFNNYSTMSTQLQLARAKVQERTPAFTTLQSATVPLRPSGPKRVIFVAFITAITFICTTMYAAYREKCF